MRKDPATQTRRTWRAPWTVDHSGRGGRGRGTRGGLPFAGARHRKASSPRRFSGPRLGRRRGAGSGRQSRAGSAITFPRGLFGAVAKNKPSMGSRKGPALLAALAGLGAAGAAVIARRTRDKRSPRHAQPAEPISDPMPGAAAASPPETAPPPGTA